VICTNAYGEWARRGRERNFTMTDNGSERARKLLKTARFTLSVPEARLLPADVGREIAFAGRSNAGKSSALNVLCGQRGLARTSRTPGRTQHIVVFELDAERRLIDLPGFGYAKVAKSMRAHWEDALPEYLETRASLAGLVLLMDIRHPLKPQDLAVLEWCNHAGVAAHVLLNKSDKLGRGPATATLHQVTAAIAKRGWAASAQLFSALKQDGAEQAWQVLAEWLQLE
jgi:GTP-binding protein